MGSRAEEWAEALKNRPLLNLKDESNGGDLLVFEVTESGNLSVTSRGGRNIGIKDIPVLIAFLKETYDDRVAKGP